MSSLSAFLHASYSAFLADLAALVGVDCGTHNKAGVDRVGAWVDARCREWGWAVERLPLADYGDCWLARLRGTGVGRVMLIGHLDTVYPDGMAAARPLRAEGARLIGPGVCDMKGGLLVGLYALRALQLAGFRAFDELAFFFNSDEEVGSPGSQPLYGPVARGMDAALVLESARVNGDLVGARKGSADVVVRVFGRAAHPGVEPEKGANAVVELAHQIVALTALNGCAPGVTVSPDIVGGGTKTNIIPDEAWTMVDVRAVDPAGAGVVMNALRALPERTTVPGTRVVVEGEFHYPPMASTPAVRFLVALAQQEALKLGFAVQAAATGGASDANILASLGVPVLDGLGPIGGLDHSPNEFIEPASFAPRAALLAGLIQSILQHRDELAGLRER